MGYDCDQARVITLCTIQLRAGISQQMDMPPYTIITGLIITQVHARGAALILHRRAVVLHREDRNRTFLRVEMKIDCPSDVIRVALIDQGEVGRLKRRFLCAT